jgi:hypothetical protein
LPAEQQRHQRADISKTIAACGSSQRDTREVAENPAAPHHICSSIQRTAAFQQRQRSTSPIQRGASAHAQLPCAPLAPRMLRRHQSLLDDLADPHRCSSRRESEPPMMRCEDATAATSLLLRLRCWCNRRCICRVVAPHRYCRIAAECPHMKEEFQHGASVQLGCRCCQRIASGGKQRASK